MARKATCPRRYLDDLPDFENLTTEYTIESSLGIQENARFHRIFDGEVFATEDGNEDKKPIGRMSAQRLYIGEALNHGWNAEAVFDVEDETMELGKAIYDFDGNWYNSKVLKHFKDSIIGLDILLIDNIEVLPNYRGMDIGAHALKDMILMFSQDAGLVILDVFPGQFREGWDKQWREKMNYDNYPTDFDASFLRLSKYFQRLGFNEIRGIARRYMFLNTENVNKLFKAIELD